MPPGAVRNVHSNCRVWTGKAHPLSTAAIAAMRADPPLPRANSAWTGPSRIRGHAGPSRRRGSFAEAYGVRPLMSSRGHGFKVRHGIPPLMRDLRRDTPGAMLRLLRFHLIRGTLKRGAKADAERWLTWVGYAIWRGRQSAHRADTHRVGPAVAFAFLATNPSLDGERGG